VASEKDDLILEQARLKDLIKQREQELKDKEEERNAARQAFDQAKTEQRPEKEIRALRIKSRKLNNEVSQARNWRNKAQKALDEVNTKLWNA
jgi:hypothetical protein